MDDLIAFLLARLDENERHVERLRELAAEDNAWRDDEEEESRVDRYTADLDAKRHIVNMAKIEIEAHPTTRSWDWWSERAVARNGVWEDILPLLALPYADHPDYREEWQPK